MKKNYVLGLVFVAALGLGVYFAMTPKSSNLMGPSFGAANAAVSGEADTSAVVDMVMGAEDAPITIIEYASYTCPHCRSFHEKIFKQLETDYIKTGKVLFTYREVYFDRPGLWASMVARCDGGNQKFFAISDILYSKQSEWHKPGSSLAEVASNLRQIGKAAGLSPNALQACFSDGEKAKTLYAWYQEKAKADGITSTPSILVNGIKQDSIRTYEDLKQILDAQ